MLKWVFRSALFVSALVLLPACDKGSGGAGSGTDGSGSVEIDNAEITVSSVKVGKATVTRPGRGTREWDTPLTIVTVKIKKTGSSPISYYTWRERGHHKIVDAGGKTYMPSDPSLTGRPEGALVENETNIEPGKSIEDVLIFDPLPDNPGALKLELGTMSIKRQGSWTDFVTVAISPEKITR